MTMPQHESLWAWAIIIPATAGVIVRPFRLPEAVWAVMAAVALGTLGLLTPREALNGVAKGLDLYLFLTGMMLTTQLSRREGLFHYLAPFAVQHAHGSLQTLL